MPARSRRHRVAGRCCSRSPPRRGRTTAEQRPAGGDGASRRAPASHAWHAEQVSWTRPPRGAARARRGARGSRSEPRALRMRPPAAQQLGRPAAGLLQQRDAARRHGPRPPTRVARPSPRGRPRPHGESCSAAHRVSDAVRPGERREPGASRREAAAQQIGRSAAGLLQRRHATGSRPEAIALDLPQPAPRSVRWGCDRSGPAGERVRGRVRGALAPIHLIPKAPSRGTRCFARLCASPCC